MKFIRSIVVGIAVVTAGYMDTSVAQEVAVTIDQITTNKSVSGFVRGIAPAECGKYKVIFYVHTDQWYIHPYAGQDEGKSWAAIKPNGTWQIKTVQREFKANKIAALVVDRQYPEPNRVEDVQGIPHAGIVIRELRNTGDYGKL
jgi:hypothetical protein